MTRTTPTEEGRKTHESHNETAHQPHAQTMTDSPEEETPLYIGTQQELNLYGSMWPPKLAMIFEFLANVIEQRGAKGLDRDPGETADWLRIEVQKFIEAEKNA